MTSVPDAGAPVADVAPAAPGHAGQRSREALAALAAETVAIIERGRYLAPSGTEVAIGPAVAAQACATRVHAPEAALPRMEGPPRRARVGILDRDAVEAIREAGDADGGACRLVFASAKRPGGGFLTGANAQEESLARSSTLYRSLLEVPGFYERAKAERDLAYTDGVIHAPGALLLRDGRGALLERPVACAFVVAAAPNVAAMRDRQPGDLRKVPGIVARRAVRIVAACARHGHRRLILGAWGCGVFGNEPALVAAAFRDALAAYPAFDDVAFAIPGGESPTRAAFAAAFRTP